LSIYAVPCFDDETGEKKKPEIITFYITTKGGVHSCDQLCSNFNVGRRTRRWPLAIFNHFINVSAINAFIVFKSNMKETMERRKFLKNLVCDQII